MKADPKNLLESLSNNAATFFIPPYQRNYEWKEATCSVFFQDVKKVADSNQAGIRAEHFFGSIVYVVEESGFGIPARYVLTDGQQRITTTMLLLIALRDGIAEEQYRETIQKSYLQNDRASNDSEFKIKLKQVETDWEAYKLLALGKDVPEELQNSAVYQNYLYFTREISLLSQNDRKSLLEDGLAKFQIIAIQLEPQRNTWENPQEIFESMNSLGQPLSLADLVRNFLLMGKSSELQSTLYDEYWLKLEKKLPGQLSAFIRDWMQADLHRFVKQAKESNYKELYTQFKQLVSERSVEVIFDSFVRFAEPYAQAIGLKETGNPRIDALLFDLNSIGIGTGYSLLSELLQAREEHPGQDEAVAQILKALRTYLLRRRIVQLSAGENKFFPVLGSQLESILQDSDPHLAMLRQLSSWEYALRLPNNDELVTRLSTMNFYNFGVGKSSPRILLSMVEEYLTKSRPALDDEKLQLEHVMPQKLSDSWIEYLGDSAIDDHQELVHNVGNLTLIRHNQELGNKPFADKKEVYKSNSGLQVTQNMILDREKWDADAIRRRAEYIIQILIDKVLSIPSQLAHSSNWKQSSAGEAQFDSRQVLNLLIGETIQYNLDPRITATVISGSKVLFEGKEWNLSPLTRELKQRSGGVSASSAYQGAYYWNWEGTKLLDMDVFNSGSSDE
jgi:hypothetical protein